MGRKLTTLLSTGLLFGMMTNTTLADDKKTLNLNLPQSFFNELRENNDNSCYRGELCANGLGWFPDEKEPGKGYQLKFTFDSPIGNKANLPTRTEPTYQAFK